MFNPELTASIYKISSLVANLPDSKLDTPWHWKGHDEGVRFACFVTLLELRQLSVKLAADRAGGVKLPPVTSAQRILSHYHSAFMDLQAEIHGVDQKNAAKAPGKKQWSPQVIYSHILETEMAFTAVIRYALEGHRTQKWLPEHIPEKEYPRLYGMKEKALSQLLNSSLKKMSAFHSEFHEKILHEFSGITDKELAMPATFWEETRFHVGYRLHRYEAHLRQHIIQMQKTLEATGNKSNEGKRILRVLFAALADVNGNLISPAIKKSQECVDLARTIDSRLKDITKQIK